MERLQSLTEEDIEENIEEPLGDDDIRKYLPDSLILKYSKLAKYGDIHQLLPGETSYCIILYEDSPNKGHWVCLLKYNDIIEFFDSYGGTVDSPLKWNADHTNVALGQHPYLTNLLQNCEEEVIYNPVDYQSEKNDINTCGRHCVFRILNLIKEGKTLADYYKLMTDIRKKSKATYDEIVSFFISED